MKNAKQELQRSLTGNAKQELQRSLTKTLRFIPALLLVAAIAAAAFTGCSEDSNGGGGESTTAAAAQQGDSTTSDDSGNGEPPATQNGEGEPQDIGEGETVFLFEFTDKAGDTLSWNVHTDDTNLAEALLAVDLIEGTEGDFGLFVTVVNGVEIEEDNAYWELRVDGEMSMVGISSIDIDEDEVYSFVYATF